MLPRWPRSPALLRGSIGREKQSLAELLNRKEEELRNITTGHEEELEKLRIQLVAAKNKENSIQQSMNCLS